MVIAKENNITFAEQDISQQELLNADEVFITGSLKGVWPIVKVDQKIIGNGKIGELTIKGKSQKIPLDIEVIKLASELVQVKSEISFSRNEFEIGTGNWKNTTILKDKIKIKANIFLFK